MTSATEPAIDTIAARVKVLADPTRLKIFDLLMSGEHCNCELGDALGLAPNLISHHLGVLRGASLVDARRDPNDARWVYYSVDPEALAALATMLATFLDPARMNDRVPTCGPPVGSS